MTASNEKKCTKCSQIKSFDDFYINNLSPDGLYAWCKTCFDSSATVHNPADKADQRKNSAPPESFKESIEPVAKRCAKCKETKLIKYFPIDMRFDDGLNTHCKACLKKDERIREKLILEQQQERAEPEERKAADKHPEFNELTEKKCNECNMIKPVSEFYEQTGLKGGVSYRCRTCLQEYNDRYQKALERQVEQEKKRRKLPVQSIPKERKCNGCGKNETNDEPTRKTLIPVHAWFCDECKENKTQMYVKKGKFVYDLVGREYKVTKVLSDELVKGVFKKDNGRWSRRKVNIYGCWKTKK